MKIRDVKAEVLLCKAITKLPKAKMAETIATIQPDLLEGKPRQIFDRISDLVGEQKKVTWDVIASDPKLSKKKTKALFEDFGDISVTGKDVPVLLDTLQTYKTKRDTLGIVETLSSAIEETDSKEALVAVLQEELKKASTFGSDLSDEEDLKINDLNFLQYLSDMRLKDEGKKLPATGWLSFDAINQYFGWGSVLTFASNTSGGKSAVIGINLLPNMSLQGQSVAYQPYEMSKEQTIARLTSNISGVPHQRVRYFKNLTEEEKNHINFSNGLFSDLLKKSGGSYTIHKPLRDVSIHEALIRGFRSGRIIVLDYLNLLAKDKGVDNIEFLAGVSRAAKIFAENYNAIVIPIAQMTDDERTKYARAIEENSDNVMVWKHNPLIRKGYLQVKQSKARNQIAYPFYLAEEFERMRVYDMLEPLGLFTMLSRAKGLRFKISPSQMIGLKKLEALSESTDDGISLLKYDFQMDWEKYIIQSPPNPNFPDVETVTEMARSVLREIYTYEPEKAEAILEIIKKSEMLKPYREEIADIDLPKGVSSGLSDDVLQSMEKDMASLRSQIYTDSDRTHETMISRGKLVDREDLYAETAKTIKKPKRSGSKLIESASNQYQKYLGLYQFIALGNNQAISFDANPLTRFDLSPTPDVKDDKELVEFIHQSETDEGKSVDSIMESVMMGEGVPPASITFRQIDAYIKKVSIVGSTMNNRLTRLVNSLPKSVAIEWVTKPDKPILGSFKEKALESFLPPVIPDFYQEEKFPSVTELVGRIKSEEMVISTSTSIQTISDRIKRILSEEKQCKKISIDNWGSLLDSDQLSQSPFLLMYKKPHLMGSITPTNFFILNELVVKQIFKKGVFSSDRMIDIASFSLVHPEHRTNNPLLFYIKEMMLSRDTAKTSKIKEKSIKMVENQ